MNGSGSHSETHLPLVVASDPRYLWRFGHVLSPLGWVLGIAVFSQGGGWLGVGGYAVMCVFSFALGYGRCWRWKRSIAHNHYEVDGQYLRAFLGARLVAEVPTESIEWFWMTDYVNYFNLVSGGHSIRWPHGRLSMRDAAGHEQTLDLPPLMLWGRQAHNAAEDAIRGAISKAA